MIIKLLLTILFISGFLFVIFREIKKKTEQNSENKNNCQDDIKPKLNISGPLGVTPKNRTVILNPIYLQGNTTRKKKTNYLHISKKTKHKNKKS